MCKELIFLGGIGGKSIVKEKSSKSSSRWRWCCNSTPARREEEEGNRASKQNGGEHGMEWRQKRTLHTYPLTHKDFVAGDIGIYIKELLGSQIEVLGNAEASLINLSSMDRVANWACISRL
ncbi:hypothetical protein ACH5RR_028909 [Cinchona calisaya]|uniref:Uncharacterized protein n=1 Tax=Cinchona calisaya TaxID=153742 RepID=A0ABD2YVE3_9GENT